MVDDPGRDTQPPAEADLDPRGPLAAPDRGGAPDGVPLAPDERLALAGRLVWFEEVRRASRSVRHDLANVLNGVSFYASQLDADPPLGTPGADDAAAIADLVARGSRHLDRLRDLWRDPAEPEVVPLDPAAVVDGLGPLLAAIAEPCQLMLGPLESLVVRASRRALEEALVALVAEAREQARTVVVAVVIEIAHADRSAGVPAERRAAVRVERDGQVAGGPDADAAGTAGLAASRAIARPGFAFELASAAARAAGGEARREPLADGGERITLLLPEAMSRRRRAEAVGDEASGGG